MISDIIRDSLRSKGFRLDTIDNHQAKGIEDHIWVRRFAKAGGHAIIGGDSKMLTRPHEIVAINETGLRLIVLDPKWPQQRRHIQISYLFYWWPHIEATLAASKPGNCFKVPWGWGDATNASKRYSPDLQRAERQLKRK